MRHSVTTMVLFAMLASLPLAFAQAQPVAIVEDVAGDGIRVQIMELLTRGRVIELAPGQSVVLGYMNSCVRERIKTGHVVIGDGQSAVTGGHVEREIAACHSKGTTLAIGSSEGSGLIFRGGEDGKPGKEPILRYRAPVIVVKGALSATLRLERLDRKEALRHFTMPGPVLDLASKNERLGPGGRYRASVEGREAVFSIDRYAADVSGHVLERLILLEGK